MIVLFYSRRAFTLIEVLVVIVIVSILTSLLLPGLKSTRLMARRAACINNLQQMGQASIMYADDDSRGRFSNTISDSDDSLNWLYPGYIQTLDSFICPNTGNEIRRDKVRIDRFSGESILVDLEHAADDRYSFGSSYEVYGFMNYNGVETSIVNYANRRWRVPGVQKTVASTQSYRHKNSAFGLRGLVPGPSQIFLLLDGDSALGNFPRPESNHGFRGNNVQFCDGHVEWIAADDWLRRYEISQDENMAEP